MICLDTNAVISALNQRTSLVLMRIEETITSGATLAIASIVLFELCYAAKSAQPDRNMQRIADFLAGPIDVLPFESADAEEAGDIRAALERAGPPIGPYDILVAAGAPARRAPGDSQRKQICSRALSQVIWRQQTADYSSSSAAGKRSRHSIAATAAPPSCAAMKPGTWLSAIPANVVVRPRAKVTAGLANEVDDVNQ